MSAGDAPAGPWLARAALAGLLALTVAEGVVVLSGAVRDSDEASGLLGAVVLFGAMASVLGAVALVLTRWPIVFALYACGLGLFGVGIGLILAVYGLGTLVAPAALLLIAGLVGTRRTWPQRRLRRVAYGVTLAWAVPYALLFAGLALSH